MDPIELVHDLEQPNVRPFLWTLRLGEGTQGENGFRTMFGGGLFDSFADHPRQKITRGRLTSSAAGAYQFLAGTWDGLVKQYGFADFSPANQDLACVALIKGRKALDDVIAGRFEQAVGKCNKEWASLPGSPYGQPVVTMEKARACYEAAGGMFSDSTKEQPVPPFLLAALPSLIGAVPELVKMFGADGSKAEKMEKTAVAVMDIAKSALGAKNEQEVVDTLAADPQAAATVRQAVQDNWFALVEVGGGIQAAREANLKIQGDKPFWHNPAFFVSAALLVFPFMLMVDVFYVHPAAYDANLRTQIVTGVLAVILMVGGYWLGASFKAPVPAPRPPEREL